MTTNRSDMQADMDAMAPGDHDSPTSPGLAAPGMDRAHAKGPDMLPALVIGLLKGVLYREGREGDGRLWGALLDLQARVRDHVAVPRARVCHCDGHGARLSLPRVCHCDTGLDGDERRWARLYFCFPAVASL